MLIHKRLLILGSGPAGCTAAIYAARANLQPTLITGLEQGGQLTKTHKIDNWPGEAAGISGTELMEKMLSQAKRFDTDIISDVISECNLLNKPFILKGENTEYSCDALIIATGASAKYLEIPSEKKYLGKGVSTCAVCDGFFYKNAEVAIIGGGNTAIEDALYLAKIAKKVTLIHRRSEFRAEPILLEKLKSTANISFELNQVPEEILGNEQGVTGITVKNTQTGELKTISAKGIFIAIGYKSNADIFANQINMEEGSIKIYSKTESCSTATNIPGVFAAGDVADRVYRQAITSAGSGCRAALDAKKYLNSLYKS